MQSSSKTIKKKIPDIASVTNDFSDLTFFDIPDDIILGKRDYFPGEETNWTQKDKKSEMNNIPKNRPGNICPYAVNKMKQKSKPIKKGPKIKYNIVIPQVEMDPVEDYSSETIEEEEPPVTKKFDIINSCFNPTWYPNGSAEGNGDNKISPFQCVQSGLGFALKLPSTSQLCTDTNKLKNENVRCATSPPKTNITPLKNKKKNNRAGSERYVASPRKTNFSSAKNQKKNHGMEGERYGLSPRKTNFSSVKHQKKNNDIEGERFGMSPRKTNLSCVKYVKKNMKNNRTESERYVTSPRKRNISSTKYLKKNNDIEGERYGPSPRKTNFNSAKYQKKNNITEVEHYGLSPRKQNFNSVKYQKKNNCLEGEHYGSILRKANASSVKHYVSSPRKMRSPRKVQKKLDRKEDVIVKKFIFSSSSEDNYNDNESGCASTCNKLKTWKTSEKQFMLDKYFQSY